MSSQTVDLIKYFGASVVPVAASLVTFLLTNRHARLMADADRAHQKQLAADAAADQRTEHRYTERLDAVTHVVDAATAIRDRALEDEYRGKETPSDYLDGPELESYFRPLRESINALLLVGTQRTREAAERLQTATEGYAWSWESDKYTELDQALIDLRAAARVDLGIDAGGTEVASAKPAPPERRGDDAK
ncbi:MAG TPA: hypothetical protein VG502_10610 [Flexivirga sp.]|uniref:hypothetical protein n=1 Tax=Flexivirga sp. TaxID=1962927 RepID=UPI002BDEFD86|nr:hypothetical protein [Flexivirga sp.]HWC22738.1 hypothetical protein [Flexivirga sp.]